MDKRSLEQLAQQFKKSKDRTENLRKTLATAIRLADEDGVPQKDICEATGYTRQQVRRIIVSPEPDEDGTTGLAGQG